MFLTKTTTSTALAVVPKSDKAKQPVKTQEPTPAKAPSDGVDIKSYDGDVVPADDDGPGAGGGYKPKQDPVEGPGAGGGYDSHEIPADDDGPGAGGGYDQDPAESDGPGAGGGYIIEKNSWAGQGFWNRPLTVLNTPTSVDWSRAASDYNPQWVQLLPMQVSWSKGSVLEPLMVEAQPQVAAAPQAGKEEKKA